MVRRRPGVLGGMNKIILSVAAGALAVTLAACGASSNNTSSSAPSSVLKDTSGMALYTPAGESTSNIRCTGLCTSIWMPVSPGAAKVSGASAITRPDGKKQLAIGGKPLYTFSQDSPGQVSGNGVSDSFGSKSFTWHAVKAGGTTAATTTSKSSGGGYGNSGY
jgi:predicted lipoprotein with Yx(FWY)xxD motif